MAAFLLAYSLQCRGHPWDQETAQVTMTAGESALMEMVSPASLDKKKFTYINYYPAYNRTNAYRCHIHKESLHTSSSLAQDQCQTSHLTLIVTVSPDLLLHHNDIIG